MCSGVCVGLGCVVLRSDWVCAAREGFEESVLTGGAGCANERGFRIQNPSSVSSSLTGGTQAGGPRGPHPDSHRLRGGSLPVLAPPAPFEGQTPRVRRDELVDRIRTPRPRAVAAHRWRIGQQRRRHLPQSLDALGRRVQGPVALHGVEDQPFVGLEDQAGMLVLAHPELQG